MDLKAIEIILFDLGDVVCHFVPDERRTALSIRTGLTETQVEEKLWGSGFQA
jgi:hypothetical protein